MKALVPVVLLGLAPSAPAPVSVPGMASMAPAANLPALQLTPPLTEKTRAAIASPRLPLWCPLPTGEGEGEGNSLSRPSDAGRWFDVRGSRTFAPALSADDGAPSLRARPPARVQADPQAAPNELWITFANGVGAVRATELTTNYGLKKGASSDLGPRLSLQGFANDAIHAALAALALRTESDVLKLSAHPDVVRRVGIPKPNNQAPADRVLDRAAVRRFAEGLLAQGDKRGGPARIAAAELWAALSTPADLPRAREWIAREDLDAAHPDLMAAGLTLGLHGDPPQDAPRLLLALERLSQRWGHVFRPAQTALVPIYAAMLAPTSPESAPELLRRYEEEKAKPQFARDGLSARNPLLMDALYLLLCRRAGPDLKLTMLVEGEHTGSPALYDYLKRVDPDLLGANVANVRRGKHPFKLLWIPALRSLAESDDPKDFDLLLDLIRTGWNGALDHANGGDAAEAFAGMVARLNAYGTVKDELRRWLAGDLKGIANYARMSAAIKTAGAAGTPEDLPGLERVLRADPERVGEPHAMSQSEAAAAWAKIVFRSGLWKDYATVPESGGGKPLPRLQRMLADRNPYVNQAALETLKLIFERNTGTRP